MKKDKLTKEEKKARKKKSKSRKVVKIILITLLIILLAAGGVFAYKVYKNGWSLQGLLTTIVGKDAVPVENLDKFYVLVVGRSQNLTDTLMLCSYDPKTQQASILSIPRDTFVGKNKKYATAWDKINALYQQNPQKTIDAVSNITGIDIENYATIDTKALRDVVDALGGVYFDVPMDMDYDDSSQNLYIHLKKGYQLLDGSKAEQVVRFRHNNDGSTYPSEYGQQDLGRMRTQREFLTAVAKQFLKPSNIMKVYDFIDIFNENVQTNISVETIKKYVPYAVEFNTENITTETLPGEPEYCNGVSVFVHDPVETQEVVERLFIGGGATTEEAIENGQASNTLADGNIIDETTGKKVSTDFKLEILNATGDSAALKSIIKKYETAGYTVKTSSTITTTAKTVVINRTNNTEAEANALTKVLGVGVVNKGEDNQKVDFTIVVGADYR